MTLERLNWWQRVKFWRAAYYLLFDVGAKALPSGEPLATGCKGGGRDFEEWAIDLRARAGDDILEIDQHYECMSDDPGKEYKPTPPAIKSVVNSTWLDIETNASLVAQGHKITGIIWGENSDSFVD